MAPVSAYQLDLPTCDLSGADRADRLSLIDSAREQHWLARTAIGLMILHYEDSVAVLRDRRFHSAMSLIPKSQGVTATFLEKRRPSLLALEGDEHTRLRRIVTSAFTPAAANRLRPFMRSTISELVDAVYAEGRCDFVADVSDPYPIPIICQLLGAPRQDWQLFSHWATEIFRLFNQNLAEDLPTIQHALGELGTYVRSLVDRRRTEPGEDLLSALIAAGVDDHGLSSEDLVMLVEAVLMAGTDTVRNQLACSIAVLAEHPKQWRMLVEQPDLAPRAVEETMRYLGAVQGSLRFASEDIEYRGVVFPAGTLVSIPLAGVNRDPEVFMQPDRFDLQREAEVPQLTFGSGIHYCLGANLARAELQEALVLIAERMPSLELAGPVEWKPESFGIWGPSRLPISWTPQAG
jgi:cytochrome P450